MSIIQFGSRLGDDGKIGSHHQVTRIGICQVVVAFQRAAVPHDGIGVGGNANVVLFASEIGRHSFASDEAFTANNQTMVGQYHIFTHNAGRTATNHRTVGGFNRNITRGDNHRHGATGTRDMVTASLVHFVANRVRENTICSIYYIFYCTRQFHLNVHGVAVGQYIILAGITRYGSAVVQRKVVLRHIHLHTVIHFVHRDGGNVVFVGGVGEDDSRKRHQTVVLVRYGHRVGTVVKVFAQGVGTGSHGNSLGSRRRTCIGHRVVWSTTRVSDHNVAVALAIAAVVGSP